MEDVRELLKSSILRIQQQDIRIRSLEAAAVAIVAVAGRFPGGEDLDSFWAMIERGGDGLSTMRDQRWPMDNYYSAEPAAAGKIAATRFGLLNGVDGFDPAAFRISDTEADYIDPQQRLLLEQAWYCLERGGLDVARLRGTGVGVFIGQMNNDYSRLLKDVADLTPLAGIGSAPSAASGRLSYAFGLTGPSVTVDTACSSSLVAIHLACQSLRAGECDLALAGGVNLILTPEAAIAASAAGMLSAQGRCNTFGDGADGYVRAEGCGLVLLKPLARATADGDRVLAVIRGSAVNQDGRSHGLSAPNGPAQAAVMRRALAAAGLEPSEISYIETHGTGTPLGDPVEVQALDSVYGRAGGRVEPLALGAVKANIGHCESAAGVAGLIKLVLMIDKGLIPPIAHLGSLNPHLSDAGKMLDFPRGGARPWPAERRTAALSSFGYTGTNAHLILAAPEVSPSTPRPQPEALAPCALWFGAHSRPALRSQLETVRQHLEADPALDLETLAASLNPLRGTAAWRSGLLVASRHDLQERLCDLETLLPDEPARREPIALLFGDADDCGEPPPPGAVFEPLEAALVAAGTTLAQAWSDPNCPARCRLVRQLHRANSWERAGLAPVEILAKGEGGIAAAVFAELISPDTALALAEGLDTGATREILGAILAARPLQRSRYVLRALDASLGVAPEGITAVSAWLLRLIESRGGSPAQALVRLDVDRQRVTGREVEGAGLDTLQSAAVTLYNLGLILDWTQLRATAIVPRALQYPFVRRRCWLPDHVLDRGSALPLAFHPVQHPWLGAAMTEPGGAKTFVGELSLVRLPFLKAHKVDGDLVVPGSLFADAVLFAAEGAFVSSLRLSEPCVASDKPLAIYCRLDPDAGDGGEISLWSRSSAAEAWRCHAVARLAEASAAPERRIDLVDFDLENQTAEPIRAHYERARAQGVEYGDAFQLLTSLHRVPGRALGRVSAPAAIRDVRSYCLHPALLDACLQIVAAAVAPVETSTGGALFVPVSLDNFHLCKVPDGDFSCHVRLLAPDGVDWSDDATLRDWLERTERLEAEITAFSNDGIELFSIGRFEAVRYRKGATSVEAWRNWIFERNWITAAESAGGAVLPSSGDLLSLGKAEIAVGLENGFSGRSDDEKEALQALACAYARDALRALGADEATDAAVLIADHGVRPEFARLASRLIDLAAAAGDEPAASLGREMRPCLTGVSELDLLQRCGEALPAVLRGERKAVDLLLAAPGETGAGEVYEETQGTRHLNGVIAAITAYAAAHRTGSRPLRILEVGAGTGATTSCVLPRLAGLNAQYVFTDISRHFINAAEDTFSAFDFIDFRRLDIGKDPVAQGFTAGEFDVVIAVNILHATPDLGAAVANIRTCLRDGGVLLLRELTETQAWLDLTFGLTDGWWSYEDETLRPQGPLIDVDAWQTLLRRQGFIPACVTAGVADQSESVFVAAAARKQRAARHWALFSDGGWQMRDIAQALSELGDRVSHIALKFSENGGDYTLATPSAEAVSTLLANIEHSRGPLTGIVYGWAVSDLGLADQTLGEALGRCARTPLAICQAVLEPRWRNLELSFLTVGAQSAGEIPLQAPLQALIWGQIFSFINENDRFTRLIDLDPDGGSSAAAAMEISEGNECQVAFRGLARLVARLEPGRIAEVDAPVIRGDATYLITGGFGALGLETARLLAEQGARFLILAGRTPDPKLPEVRALEAQGIAVVCLALDVARLGGIEDQVQGALAGLPPLRGVIHSVGVLADGIIAQQSWERYMHVIGPKVLGAINVERATRDCPLDFFVIYSSASSILGNPGQANHATANAFLDAFAWYRRGRGLPALSVNWGGWSEVGAAASGEVAQRLADERSLIGPIPRAQGLAVIERQFACANTQFAVIPIRRNVWPEAGRQPHLQRLLAPIMATLAPSKSAVRPSTQAIELSRDGDIMLSLRNLARSDRRDVIEAHLAAMTGTLIKHKGVIDPNVSLFEIGLDSLLAIDLRTRLEREFDQSFASTLLFDHPTLAGLSAYLSQASAAGVEAAGAQVEASVVSAPLLTPHSALPQRADYVDGLADEGAIAVIGIGCRFPGGANSPDLFWKLLSEGLDVAMSVPPDRWDHSLYYQPGKFSPGKIYTSEGYFLDRVDLFYPERYGISGIEANLMDPQQRLLLDACWAALETAGLDPTTLVGVEAGVFMGIMTQDYLHLTKNVSEHAFYVGTGSANSILAGRIAHAFGLTGPTMTVDTACSSSLVTVMLACQNLRLGACDMALAGGVSLQLVPETLVLECAGGMISPSGRCHTFDSGADGFARGEGCGALVLKRLADAIADGDPIIGVIRGGAVNHDGRAGGLTVPDGAAQRRVIERALADARLTPQQVSYVEAHGTGTKLGDPIELNALASVYGKGRIGAELTIGSVKTNIGHTEAAAGMASLIKVLLSLKHRQIPAHLHFEQHNPNYDWDGCNFAIAGQLQTWPGEAPRRAGVSAFGLSGTNAHILVEEFLPVDDQSEPPQGFVPVALLSNVDLEYLARDAAAYAIAFEGNGVNEAAYTLSVSRASYSVKAAIFAPTAEALRDNLRALAAGAPAAHTALFAKAPTRPAPLLFRLGEETPAWQADAQGLYHGYAAFRDAVDAIVVASAHLGVGISVDELLASEGGTPVRGAIVQYAYASLLVALGVSPALVEGRGMGLFCGLRLAGAIDDRELAVALLTPERAISIVGSATLSALSMPVRSAGEAMSQALTSLADRLVGACYIDEARAAALTPVELAAGRLSVLSTPVPAEVPALPAALAAVAALGHRIDWTAYFAPAAPRRIGLPATSFPAKRYWVPEVSAPARAPISPLPQNPAPLPALLSSTFDLSTAEHSFLRDHTVDGRRVLAAAGVLALQIAAAVAEQEAYPLLIERVRFLREAGLEDRIEIGLFADVTGRIEARQADAQGAWRSFATFGQVGPAPEKTDDLADHYRLLTAVEAATARPERSLSGSEFYSIYTSDKLMLGSSYRRIAQIWRKNATAVAMIKTERSSPFPIDPQALDACLQTVMFIDTGKAGKDGLYLPVSVGCIRIEAWPQTDHFWCLAEFRGPSQNGEALIYDLTILNERDAVCARFENVVYRRMSMPITAKQPRLFHTVNWVHEPLVEVGRPQQLVTIVSGERDIRIALAEHPSEDAGPPPMRGKLDLLEHRGRIAAWIDAQTSRILVYGGLLTQPFDPYGSRGAAQMRVRLEDLAQWLVAAAESGRKFLVLTISPMPPPVIALVRTACLEHTGAQLCCVEIAGVADLSWRAELAAKGDAVIAWREGLRFKPALTPVEPGRRSDAPPFVRPDRTYLITGGLGGLGQAVTDRLVAEGARSLAIFGRSVSDADVTRLSELRDRGCTVRLFLGDVGDAQTVSAHVEALQREMLPLAGVFHAAGRYVGARMNLLGREAWDSAWRSKVDGAINLIAAVDAESLDYIVLFSSVAAIGGASGQAPYAAANAMLDMFALRWRAEGVPAISINWGAWQGTGMAARAQARGVVFRETLSIEQGLDALASAICGPRAQIVCYTEPAEADTRSQKASAEAAPGPSVATNLASQLRNLVSDYLSVDMTGLSEDIAFFDIGMDSVSAVDFARQTGETFGIDLPVDVLFDHSSVRALAAHIAAELAIMPRPPALAVALALPQAEAEAGSRPAPGGCNVEAWLRDRLGEFLAIDMTGLSDDIAFFDIGMDSVSAVDFARQTGETFGIDLPVDVLFDHSSVRALAAHIAASVSPEPAPSQTGPTPRFASLTEELAYLLSRELDG